METVSNSTYRDILALEEVYLGEKASRFSGLSVKHLTDDKGVVVALQFGSPKENIQEFVFKIFNQCRKQKIKLVV